MSQRIYRSAVDKTGAPVELIRWQIAERFGWTLEYVDGLSVADIHEYTQVQDGIGNVRKSIIT